MYNFKEVESESRKVWNKHKKEIKKAVQDNPRKPMFSFLDGPPTANAPPALHHFEVRTFKDIICKFKYMQGFSVPRKSGWDCHGLPVEVQVEKKLGLNSKKEILNFGVEKFIKECRDSVFSNILDWKKSTEKLGFWIDLENPYVTLENDYIESVWWSLKELYKKEMLYEDFKVVPFCPRCETPLSSHEVALGYKDVKEDSVYVAFKIKNKQDEFILAWTTTPWTSPGNVALAVGEKINYVKVKLQDGRKLILARERLSVIKDEYKIVEEMKGKNLVGIEYEPLYDIKELQNKNSHKVVLGDFVTTEDGTGIVHTAVMYGEDDYNLGKELDLPRVHTVGQDGKFLENVPRFNGIFVKSAEDKIIQDLKERKHIYKVEKVEHSYPFCWRCSTPLLYYAINSWFIRVSEFRDKLVKENKKINWVPETIRDGRFGNWLEGAKDWALSRFKFWGTPLPIWKCSCGNEEIIGSIEELKKKATKKIGDIDLHKPQIDDVKLKCLKCKKEMSRVSDVIDCWYDSGSASFAQYHYPFENKKIFEKSFPYIYIAEAIDQTRGWFYTLHVLGVLLFGKSAYKNVICAGHVVDEKGEKMSKSKGNVLNPNEMIEQSGVDSIRLQFCTTAPGEQKRFSFNLMKESVIPFLTILYNCNNYYHQLINKKCKMQIEDKWILSRLNSTILEVTSELERFSIDSAFRKIQNFVVNDFSRGYIKITRDRDDNKEIVGEVLEKISLLLAPFAPYISEFVYQNFSRNSVHLSNWPKIEKKKNVNLDIQFHGLNLLIEKGLKERDKAQVGLRWPLPRATIAYYIKLDKEVEEILKTQLNVKNIKWKKETGADNWKVELDTKITPELEAEGYAREISRLVQGFRKDLGLVKDDVIELKIFADDELKRILKSQEKFIANRTNSENIEIISRNVTTIKEEKSSKRGQFEETFKNKIDFKVKDKRGEIVIIRK
ncbi:MAG: isoleucine--tRNA ligase [Nanoarchaeota archaeon]